MLTTLAAFSAGSEETAIVQVAAIVAFALAAFASGVAGRYPGGAIGLIATGLALVFLPTAWQAADVAFS
jgi:hypothetical protein